jgi:hypothetical protein
MVSEYAAATVNVVGKIVAVDDTLGTPSAPLASGPCSVGEGSVLGMIAGAVVK